MTQDKRDFFWKLDMRDNSPRRLEQLEGMKITKATVGYNEWGYEVLRLELVDTWGDGYELIVYENGYQGEMNTVICDDQTGQVTDVKPGRS